MGTKTTINDKGVVTEKVAGSGVSFVVDGKQLNSVFNAADDTGPNLANVNDPVVVLNVAVAGVTASLPGVSTENVGTTFTLVNVGGTTYNVSGTNPINGSGAELGISDRSYVLMAVSSSANGFSWEQIA